MIGVEGRYRKTIVLVVAVLAGHMALGADPEGREPRQGAVQVNERDLRAQATLMPKPIYPSALVARRVAGVAVAAVVVGPNDRVESVVLLEAPDPLMAESVNNAVRQWTF